MKRNWAQLDDQAMEQMLDDALGDASDLHDDAAKQAARAARILALTAGSAGLNHALSAADCSPPASLSSRILALTAGQASLDHALGAQGISPPDGMTEQVLRVTSDAGSDADVVSSSAPQPRMGVLARITPAWQRRIRYAAAVVILGAEVAIGLNVAGIVSNAQTIVVVRERLQQIDSYAGPSSEIDLSLRAMALKIDAPLADQDRLWARAQSDLEAALANWDHQDPGDDSFSTF